MRERGEEEQGEDKTVEVGVEEDLLPVAAVGGISGLGEDAHPGGKDLRGEEDEEAGEEGGAVGGGLGGVGEGGWVEGEVLALRFEKRELTFVCLVFPQNNTFWS